MKLTLNNIGIIKNASIDINGITVIGGENNTGKSTVSKVLFSVLNAAYDLKNTIKSVRVNSFAKAIDRFLFEKNSMARYDLKARRLLIRQMNDSMPEKSTLNSFKKFITSNPFLKKVIDTDKIDKTKLEDLYSPFTITNDELITGILGSSFFSEFQNQVCNVNQSCAKVDLQIDKKRINIEIEDKKIVETSIKDNFVLNSDVHYLDNSVMIDQINNFNMFIGLGSSRICSHTNKMLRLLIQESDDDVVNKIIVDKELKDVFDIINEICPGDIVNKDGLEFQYLSDNKVAFSMENVSAGLKTFAIIKTLLSKGFIKKSDVLILDEPEIHLHPKWQVVFAKLIVLLQQKFDLKILINTHSPYFLNALEVFIDKYKVVSKNCKFYLSSLDENGDAIFYDETNSVDKIYDLLAQPFQELENMKYE